MMKFRLIESVMDKLQELHNILGSWEYGAIQNGKRYDENLYHEIDFNKWVTRPINELEKDKIGNCWDFVHYQHYWLNKNKIDNDTYMLYIDKDGNPDNAITHSFTIVDNKYWFEEAAYPCHGTHKINDIKDVAEMINDKIYHLDCRYYIWKYNPDGLLNGLNPDQYMQIVTVTDPIIEGKFDGRE